MQLINLLTPDKVIFDKDLHSKKQVLKKISDLCCQSSSYLDNKNIFNCFLEREKLSSTALGHGVAIPHCRSEKIQEPIACLIALNESIDFGALDKKPVNIIFGLVVPEENHKQHLELLAEIAKLLSNDEIRNNLNKVTNSAELYQQLK